jgi:membrane protein required for colicin V production
MNFLDIFIICFVLLLVIWNIKKGFIIGLASLLALILGIYAAVHFSNYLDDVLMENLKPSRTWLPFLSFTITFLVVIIAVMFLAKVLEKIVDLVGMGIVNHIFGGIFGLLKSLFILSIAFFILGNVDPQEKLIKPDIKQKSIFYGYIEKIFPLTMKAFGSEIRFPGMDKR